MSCIWSYADGGGNTQRDSDMRSPINDFDFFIGSWKVSHRRLKQRLAGCQDWEAFGGESSVQKILGGYGNIDDNILELPGAGYRAVSLRSVDPHTGCWSIWWLDGRYPGRLDTPVVGRFEQGSGTFLATDVLEGKPIRVRFLWTRTDTNTPRWELAFSADNGESWETNWFMDFNRSA
jgi:hypothetical protein